MRDAGLGTGVVSLMCQEQPPPFVFCDDTRIDLWSYRRRTIALLRRYARASVEVGRLPSLLGREFFRTRVTSYRMGSFEDIVIFVIDMEQAIDKLDSTDKKLLAMYVLEEYTIPEVARLMGGSQRTVERSLQTALDELTRTLLRNGLMDELPLTRQAESCQVARHDILCVSPSKEGRNNQPKIGGSPGGDLIS
jgi:Sigma-70, region 4